MDTEQELKSSLKCNYPGCGAWAMSDGSNRCYWHNENIDTLAKQKSRSLGGRSSKRVEIWNAPDEITSIETLLDCKKMLNSLLQWLLCGFISPAQGLAAKAIVSELREAILSEELIRVMGYRERLKNVLGNNGHEAIGEAYVNDEQVATFDE